MSPPKKNLFSIITRSFFPSCQNGGHCEFAIMTLRFFSSTLALGNKFIFIFVKFREWWPPRICHHDNASFSPCMKLKKFWLSFLQKICEWLSLRNWHHETAFSLSPILKSKCKTHFCKISQMVSIANFHYDSALSRKSRSTLKRKSKLIFSILRKGWPSRPFRHDT